MGQSLATGFQLFDKRQRSFGFVLRNEDRNLHQIILRRRRKKQAHRWLGLPAST
jgi:ribosomal protein L34